MATVGGGAAYRQLERLPNDLGRAMEGIANRQQAEGARAQRINEDRKIAKQKRDDAFRKSIEIDPDKFVVEATGWNDADEIFMSLSKNSMEQSIDLLSQSSKAWDAGNEELAQDLRNQAKRIETTFKNFGSTREEFAAIITDTRTKINEGKILDKAEGQFIDALDRHEYTAEYKDGDVIITAVVRDKNGKLEFDENGKSKYIQRSMNDVRKGLHRPFEFEDAYGEDGMINNMMVNFGTKKLDEVTGQYIVTRQEWSPANEAGLVNYIEGVTGGPDEEADNREMYKWYKNATGQQKFDDWTEEDKQIVADYIRDGVASQYSESIGRKVRGMTAAERKSMNDDNIRARAAEGAANRAAAKERWQAEIEAKIAADKNKAKVKAMGKNPEQKAAAVGLYRLAQKIAELPSDSDEQKVQDILDQSEYGFLLGGDLDNWFGFGDTEYDIKGGGDGIQIKDVFANFKAMAKASGLDLKDTDLKEVMANPEKYKLDEETTEEVQKQAFDPNKY